MKREIKFTPAFDRTDPDPSKNFGIHCMEMDFILTGPDSAIVFTIFTGWNLPHVRDKTSSEIKPRGALTSYHSRRSIYGESITSDVCSYLSDSPCYHDATYCVDDVFDLFVAKGEETVWKNLEQRYVSLFGKLDWIDLKYRTETLKSHSDSVNGGSLYAFVVTGYASLPPCFLAAGVLESSQVEAASQ